MVKDRDSNEFRSELGLPNSLSADRGDQRISEISDDDPNLREEREMRAIFTNASRIPHGHAQLMAALAAGRPPESRTIIQNEKERQRQNSERYHLQEMQRLAEWNAKVVTIAGVQMTNEEAQRARRHFIENEDEYAERAVQRGLIRDGEQSELKDTMRRRRDLEDRVGRGNATAAEHKELHDIKNSRMGRATDEMTAEIHKEREVRADVKNSLTKDHATTATDGLPSSREIFQTTPLAQKDFMQAAQAVPVDAPEPASPAVAPLPVSREVKVTGLGV